MRSARLVFDHGSGGHQSSTFTDVLSGRAVSSRLGAVALGAFQFLAPLCDRIVAAVLERSAAS